LTQIIDLVPGLSELETELQVGADLLADHGFSLAADAVRVMYPRLPAGVLTRKKLVEKFLLGGVKNEELFLQAVFDEGPQLPRVRVTEATSGRRLVETGDHDVVDLTFMARARTGRSSSLTAIRLWLHDGLVGTVKFGWPQPFSSGDTLNLSYEIELPDFLLCDEAVAKLVPRLKESL
jgi:hypothetical protein